MQKLVLYKKGYVPLFHMSGLMVSKAYIISVIICTPENKVISVLNHVSDTSSSDLSNWLFCCSFTPSLDLPSSFNVTGAEITSFSHLCTTVLFWPRAL